MSRKPVGTTFVHSLEKATLIILEWLYCFSKPPQKPVSKFRLPKAERNKQIIKRYNQGVTLADLSCDYDISIARVHQIIKRWGSSD